MPLGIKKNYKQHSAAQYVGISMLRCVGFAIVEFFFLTRWGWCVSNARKKAKDFLNFRFVGGEGGRRNPDLHTQNKRKW